LRLARVDLKHRRRTPDKFSLIHCESMRGRGGGIVPRQGAARGGRSGPTAAVQVTQGTFSKPTLGGVNSVHTLYEFVLMYASRRRFLLLKVGSDGLFGENFSLIEDLAKSSGESPRAIRAKIRSTVSTSAQVKSLASKPGVFTTGDSLRLGSGQREVLTAVLLDPTNEPPPHPDDQLKTRCLGELWDRGWAALCADDRSIVNAAIDANVGGVFGVPCPHGGWESPTQHVSMHIDLGTTRYLALDDVVAGGRPQRLSRSKKATNQASPPPTPERPSKRPTKDDRAAADLSSSSGSEIDLEESHTSSSSATNARAPAPLPPPVLFPRSASSAAFPAAALPFGSPSPFVTGTGVNFMEFTTPQHSHVVLQQQQQQPAPTEQGLKSIRTLRHLETGQKLHSSVDARALLVERPNAMDPITSARNHRLPPHVDRRDDGHKHLFSCVGEFYEQHAEWRDGQYWTTEAALEQVLRRHAERQLLIDWYQSERSQLPIGRTYTDVAALEQRAIDAGILKALALRFKTKQ